MCLAILTDGNLPVDNLKIGLKNNPDSWGIGYSVKNAKSNFAISKGLKANDFVPAFTAALNDRRRISDMLIHFRIRTHGTRSIENAHPFRVSDHSLLIHNGMISNLETTGSESDTARLAACLSVIPEDILYTNGVFDMLEVIAGYGNKFVLLRRDGSPYIVNESLGHWIAGTWYSNRSYEAYKAPAPPPKATQHQYNPGTYFQADKTGNPSIFNGTPFWNTDDEELTAYERNKIADMTDDEFREYMTQV